MWPWRRKPAADASPRSRATGRHGEKLARRFLARNGHHILAKNYRCPAGEMDLIALDKTDGAIVFVEVKTRRRGSAAAPESAVDARKRDKLRQIARYYLSRHDAGERDVRFDVISVLVAPEVEPEIRHIRDAIE